MATPTNPLWDGWSTPFDAALETVVKQYDLLVLAWATDSNQSLFIPGAYNPDAIPENNRDSRDSRWYTLENGKLMERIDQYCIRSGVTPRQINLAWILNRDDFDALAIIYEDMPPSVDEAIGAFSVELHVI